MSKALSTLSPPVSHSVYPYRPRTDTSQDRTVFTAPSGLRTTRPNSSSMSNASAVSPPPSGRSSRTVRPRFTHRRRIAEGKNPFQLDSPEPDSGKMMDYLKGENRYASLQINFPDRAQRLYEKTVQDAKDRYAKYRKMAED